MSHRAAFAVPKLPRSCLGRGARFSHFLPFFDRFLPLAKSEWARGYTFD